MSNLTASNPPKIAVKIANMVLALGGLFSILIAAYAAYRIFTPIFAVYSEPEEWTKAVRTFYIISISAGILSAILFGLGLRLKENLKVNLSLLLIATGFAVYAVETYLEFSQHLPDQELIAGQELIADQGVIGILSDKRTKLEVLRDLKEDGIEAYPSVIPGNHLVPSSERNGLATKNGRIFPLGGISNRMMVQINENGYWMMYVGDRYGFHNPDNVYDVDTVDIVMVGDSFTEGWAVQSDENISAILRTFGLNVVSFGRAGNGPLLDFATLKEYGQLLKPKIVLWGYSEGDIGNLYSEVKSSLLSRYLNEDEFSQNLISGQNEIDRVLINYIEQKQWEITKKAEKEDRKSQQQLLIAYREEFASKQIIRILKLRNTREAVNLVPEPNAEIDPELEPIHWIQILNNDPTKKTQLKAKFKQTLEKADRLISSWNGRLYFVYLGVDSRLLEGSPDVIPLFSTPSKFPENPREFILNTVTALGIPIINFREVLGSHDDLASLYPFRNVIYHYNAQGYRLAAETIAERLRANGVLQ